MIISSQRPLPDNTQHSQQTNIHAPGGIRTHDLSRRAGADLSLRPRGRWDRLLLLTYKEINMIVFFWLKTGASGEFTGSIQGPVVSLLAQYGGQWWVYMNSLITFVSDELPRMLQVYEVSFVTKIICLQNKSTKIVYHTFSWGTQSAKISPFLSKCEV